MLTRVKSIVVLVLVVGLVAACAPAAPSPTAAPAAPAVAAPRVAPTAAAAQQPAASVYPNGSILVETAWLKANLTDPKLRIIDVRAADKFEAGHIPGAVSVQTGDLDQTVNNIQDVLPVDKIAPVLGKFGIGDDTKVVIYDDNRTMSAARILWVLEYYGSKNASVLNGGYPKWVVEGNAVTREAAKVTPATFTPRADPTKLADMAFIKANLGKGVVILDVRTPAEYQGTDVRTARGGHIPGAINVNWESFVTTGNTPVVKPAAELKQILESNGVTPGKEVVIHCQTGVRAAQAYMTLRLLGYDKVRNYDGSWQEWGNDPNTPIDK